MPQSAAGDALRLRVERGEAGAHTSVQSATAPSWCTMATCHGAPCITVAMPSAT